MDTTSTTTDTITADAELAEQRDAVARARGIVLVPDLAAAAERLATARGKARVRLLDESDLQRLVDEVRDLALSLPPEYRELVHGRVSGGQVAKAYWRRGAPQSDLATATVCRVDEHTWRIELKTSRTFSTSDLPAGVCGDRTKATRDSLRALGLRACGGRWIR